MLNEYVGQSDLEVSYEISKSSFSKRVRIRQLDCLALYLSKNDAIYSIKNEVH